MNAKLVSLEIVPFLLLPLCLGCAFFARPAPHKPVRFTEAPSPHGAERFPNWPAPPHTSYEESVIFETTPFVLASHDESVGGTTGVEKVELVFQGKQQGGVRFKAKPIPEDLDGINNAPRKELAAYAIQHLFLDPEDYVVPTTFVFCVPLELWRKNHPSGSPTLAGTDCVLVIAAYWMKDVTLPDPLYDEERFLTEPNYAYFMSNFNVFTYLIDHRDGRQGNFLVSQDAKRRNVFAVDNGSSFGPIGYNYFVPNWNVLRVAAVRKETVDRLRKLREEDLDFLAVTVQLETADDGMLRLARPGKPLDDDVGARREGKTIQLGLSEDEIEDIWERIEDLIEKVDAGDVPVF